MEEREYGWKKKRANKIGEFLLAAKHFCTFLGKPCGGRVIFSRRDGKEKLSLASRDGLSVSFLTLPS
jgi:hypothetical protein